MVVVATLRFPTYVVHVSPDLVQLIAAQCKHGVIQHVGLYAVATVCIEFFHASLARQYQVVVAQTVLTHFPSSRDDVHADACHQASPYGRDVVWQCNRISGLEDTTPRSCVGRKGGQRAGRTGRVLSGDAALGGRRCGQLDGPAEDRNCCLTGTTYASVLGHRHREI